MDSLIQLAPQIGIALVVIAAVAWLGRQNQQTVGARLEETRALLEAMRPTIPIPPPREPQDSGNWTATVDPELQRRVNALENDQRIINTQVTRMSADVDWIKRSLKLGRSSPPPRS